MSTAAEKHAALLAIIEQQRNTEAQHPTTVQSHKFDTTKFAKRKGLQPRRRGRFAEKVVRKADQAAKDRARQAADATVREEGL